MDLEKLISTGSLDDETVINQIVDYGTDAIAPLKQVILDNSGRNSWLAAKIMASIDSPQVAPALTNTLPALGSVLQGMIVDILGELQDDRAVIPLLELLPGQRSMLQMAIVEALRKIGDPRAIDTLLQELEQTQDPIVRYTIIQALGDLGATKAIEIIKQYADDENHHVREHVIIALGKLIVSDNKT